jgi:hypothetical protein
LRTECWGEYLDIRRKKQQEAGERKNHNEELYNLYFIRYYYSDQIKENETIINVSSKEKMREAFKILVEKPEEKGPLGRPTPG